MIKIDRANLLRGCMFALPALVVLWAVLGLAVYAILRWPAPGLGIVAVVCVVTGVGYMASRTSLDW